MKSETEKIVKMCNNLGIANGKLSDEYIFTLNTVDLFYYKRNIGQVDIKTGFTDGPNDGGIDFIFSDFDTMFLIQGKSTKTMTIDDIKNVFYKMVETISKFDDKKYDSFSKNLKTAYLNAYDDLSDEKNIELVLFTNTELSEDTKAKVEEFSNTENISNYKINIYDKNDIELKAAIIAQDSELVKEDNIEIFYDGKNGNNILSYDDIGIIINVKASSVKRLYEKYGANGLFSYNLREHISQKNVDDAIDKTIKSEKDRFWFYNNGITIGCRDFRKDGTKITLYGFSIINGAQTTTKIGKNKHVNDKNDFALVCKIVKAESSNELDDDFIGKISEASNSQKPIKQRDLKSNAKEQKILQNGCSTNSKYSLAIEIKRGVKPKNYKKVEKWQRVTNEYIGQLILSCIFQRPGLARNSKNTMFSSSKLYSQIFMRKHDYNTLYDLVRIGSIYDEFLIEYSEKNNDVDYIAIAKNGKLTVLGIVSYLYKKKLGLLNDFTSDQLQKDNVSGLLVTDYIGDDLDQKMKSAFEFIIRSLGKIYEIKKESMKITSFSNFFKSDQLYEVMLKYFDDLDDYDREKLNSYLVIFDKSNSN